MSRITASFFAATLLSMPLPLAAQEAPRFDPEAVRAHVTFLADDLLEGRETGTRGYDLAAQYVATRFVDIGARPMGDPAKASYLQRVPLRRAALNGTPSLTLSGAGAPLRFSAIEEVLIGPSLLSQQQRLEAPLVFVGYGMDRADLGLKDYAGLDVKGKIVVVLSGYPKGMNTEIGAHLNASKAEMAMARGAVGIITIPTLQDTARRPWARRSQGASEPAIGWVKADGTPFSRAPGIQVGAMLNPDKAQALFAPSGKQLSAILAEADKPGKSPRGFALGQNAAIERSSSWEAVESSNIVAMLPGSDPALADEYVLMTAHLDHLGSHGKGADKIGNGALDNATGVATMLEVARALAKAGKLPRRPILFAALTGEEKGLVGADFLARNPVVGAGKVVAVVNFDMPVLTYKFSDVIAFGAENSTLGPLVGAATGKSGIGLSPDPLPQEGLFTRSDHYRFVQQGIPAVFLMTGFANGGEKAFKDFLATHYHQPSDDLSLPIDWQAGAKFAEVNYQIVRSIADADQAPQWYQGNFFGNEFAPAATKAVKPGK